ncbi:MAG: hypothetical protein A2Z34_08010 [Planctomycetes bacterium RBG_16_59_8]|nr:MAG: hypothetical protein A2Z34_08010 [Planctomycetes bacterium RBG_16_59_8]
MTSQGSKEKDIVYEILEERISFLESLKSFHNNVIELIKKHTSGKSYTPAQLLQDIVAIIQSKFNLYVVNVLTINNVDRTLVLTARASKDPQLNASPGRFQIKIGEGITGSSAASGETIVANDVSKDPRYVRAPSVATKSELAVPVKLQSTIIGVLDVQNDLVNSFRRDFVQAMEDVAFNIGFILENKQLYDTLKTQSDQLEKEVDQKMREIQESESRYRNLLENASDSILTIERNGKITWANKAACLFLGLKAEELADANITSFVKKGSLHTIYLGLKEIMDGANTKRLEVSIVNAHNETRNVEISCSAIREKDDVVCVECIMRDITEKVIVENLKKNYTKTLEEAVDERTNLIKDTQRAAILAIANLAESIDTDTAGHLERIRGYSKSLAEELRAHPKYKNIITDEYIELLFDLSPLHDLGKVGIRDRILLKPDKLTKDEFTEMQEHTEIGARALKVAGEMIRRESVFSIGEMIARYHHEKWDGSGYPAVKIGDEVRPLRGEEIPLCARVVALADVYDALCSKRPYKEPFPHEVAKKIILDGAGKHFDPDVVQAFLKREQEFLKIKKQFADEKMAVTNPFVSKKAG